MTNKNKTITFFSLLSLAIITPVYAAVDIQTLAGIPKDATAAEFIIYFFNLAVAIGAFLAVVMIIMAGIEWMTAGGNPGKIESAKDRIKNTLLGVAVLLGSYVILNIINSSLSVINVKTLECLDGIKVETKDSKNKIKYNCINQDTSNIGFNILSTKDWNDTLKESIIKVYIYSEPDYKGTITPVEFGGDIKGAKSIYFEWNRLGMYLYAGTDFNNVPEGNKSRPVFTSTSIKNLADAGFDNTVSSIRIVNPSNDGDQSSWIFYEAIAFKDPNYRGSCSFVGSWVSDMSKHLSGYYPTPISNGSLSSLIVYKAYGDDSKNRGKISLYSGPWCNGIECPIQVYTSGPPRNIADECKGYFGSGDEVQSFKITGPLGLVLMTKKYNGPGQDSGRCQYWDINDIPEGTCFPKLKGEDVYDDTSNVRPKAFMAFPVDRR